MPVTILRTRGGALDAADAGALRALEGRLLNGPSKILIHVHGGLVSQEQGEEVAIALSGEGPHSFNAPRDYEQVYVIWRTGMLETLRTNWRDLFENDRLYRAIFKRLIGYLSSKITLDGDAGRSVGLQAGLSPAEIEKRLKSDSLAPFADLDELATGPSGSRSANTASVDEAQARAELGTALQLDPEFTSAVEDMAAAISGNDPARIASAHGDVDRGSRSLDNLDSRIRNDLQQDDTVARGIVTSAVVLKKLVSYVLRVAISVLRRFKNDRDHGLHATIVEEMLREIYADKIGSAIWGVMKGDAVEHFAKGGLGADLVDILSRGDHSILLSAHSAGSIMASALLREAASRDRFPSLDLVFLAPAVRITTFAEALEKAEEKSLVRRFRMFAMKDELEKVDPVLGQGLGKIYPSSLLYLVSGLFEREGGASLVDAPLVGMQRFFARQDLSWLGDQREIESARLVMAYLASTGRTVYSVVLGQAGFSSSATTHGGFDDDPQTLESVRAML